MSDLATSDVKGITSSGGMPRKASNLRNTGRNDHCASKNCGAFNAMSRREFLSKGKRLSSSSLSTRSTMASGLGI
jgi:hypothetical protein